MSDLIERWCITKAARYENGKLLDSIDDSLKSGGHRVMVPIEDYERLEAALQHISRHWGSAEQCREIAKEALSPTQDTILVKVPCEKWPDSEVEFAPIQEVDDE